MMQRVLVVGAREMRVVRGLFVTAVFVVLRGFPVMTGGLLVMPGGLMVVLGGFLRHGPPPGGKVVLRS
jgi:hypothetical protein